MLQVEIQNTEHAACSPTQLIISWFIDCKSCRVSAGTQSSKVAVHFMERYTKMDHILPEGSNHDQLLQLSHVLGGQKGREQTFGFFNGIEHWQSTSFIIGVWLMQPWPSPFEWDRAMLRCLAILVNLNYMTLGICSDNRELCFWVYFTWYRKETFQLWSGLLDLEGGELCQASDRVDPQGSGFLSEDKVFKFAGAGSKIMGIHHVWCSRFEASLNALGSWCFHKCGISSGTSQISTGAEYHRLALSYVLGREVVGWTRPWPKLETWAVQEANGSSA